MNGPVPSYGQILYTHTIIIYYFKYIIHIIGYNIKIKGVDDDTQVVSQSQLAPHRSHCLTCSMLT